MKFRIFRIIGLVTVLGALIAGFAGIKYLANSQPAPAIATATVVVPTTTLPTAPQPMQAQRSQESLQSKVEVWLQAHPDRNGKTKAVDIMPAEAFRATAIRFPDDTAGKWSNDPRQWSQIKIDLNRDGIDDEKWLLKNGNLYKREALDGSGKTTSTDYFK